MVMARSFSAEMVRTIAVALLLILVLPVLIDVDALTLLIIYAMLAASLGLIWGFGGILCFGQAAFFGLGAYTYVIAAINIGESTVPLLLAVLLPAGFAALFGGMMFYGRLTDVYLGVMTLVVTLIFYKFMNATAGAEYVIGAARLGGFNGIPGFPTLNVPGLPEILIWGEPLYYVCAGMLLAVYLLILWLLRTSFGRIAVGIRENEERAQLMGYDIRARKTILFMIGAGIAGLSGGLYANWAEIVTPALFSLGQTAEIIIWCIVGGLGTRIGPLIGAASLSYLKLVLGRQGSGEGFLSALELDTNLILGLILVLFVLFLPRGIVPVFVALWDRGVAQLVSWQRPRRRRRGADRD